MSHTTLLLHGANGKCLQKYLDTNKMRTSIIWVSVDNLLLGLYEISRIGVVGFGSCCSGGMRWGGDAPAAAPVATDAADKFVGTWGACTPVTGATNGVLSARADYVFTKTGANNLTLSINGTGFSGATCGGTQINQLKGIATGTVLLNGTKSASGQTVDRMNLSLSSTSIPALNGATKDIAFISGTKLNFGATSVADAEGYPTLLDTTSPFVKQ